MSFCPKCGFKIKTENNICPNCGAKINYQIYKPKRPTTKFSIKQGVEELKKKMTEKNSDDKMIKKIERLEKQFEENKKD